MCSVKSCQAAFCGLVRILVESRNGPKRALLRIATSGRASRGWYLDGVLKTTVDTYLSPAQAQSVGYSVGGLTLGAHTLTIELTGTHNPNSGGSWVLGGRV